MQNNNFFFDANSGWELNYENKMSEKRELKSLGVYHIIQEIHWIQSCNMYSTRFKFVELTQCSSGSNAYLLIWKMLLFSFSVINSSNEKNSHEFTKESHLVYCGFSVQSQHDKTMWWKQWNYEKFIQQKIEWNKITIPHISIWFNITCDAHIFFSFAIFSQLWTRT